MKLLEKAIGRIPILNDVLRSIYRRFRPANKGSVSYWINRYIPNDSIQVIQIGSNDGISGDPLHRLVKKNKLWNVLFVEPVPQMFELLKKNYRSSHRFRFENSAINETGRNQIFYGIGDEAYESIPELSKDYKQIGSFSRDHVQKLSTKSLEKYIVESEVSCITFNDLLKKYEIKTIQLLQIDAEGYDWKILSQLKLNEYTPTLILFECVNLEDEEKKVAIKHLTNEYHMFLMGINYLCIRKDKLTSSDLRTLSRLEKFKEVKLIKK